MRGFDKAGMYLTCPVSGGFKCKSLRLLFCQSFRLGRRGRGGRVSRAAVL